MTASIETLKQWVNDIALLIERDEDPDSLHYAPFMQEPDLAIRLIDLIDELKDNSHSEDNFYSACIFALDVCVAQLQAAIESGSKLASKVLDQLMAHLALAIERNEHKLTFWLPILNAFYDVHVELSDRLKNAYLDLANEEDELSPEEELIHLSSIRDLITELSDLSVFDIAENFFAQSYAMPAEFFADLLADLYSIEEGHDIALLTLLHPKYDVRQVVMAVLDSILPGVLLSSCSLTRLQTIRNWYPNSYHDQFDRWIKQQRIKGVIFQPLQKSSIIHIKATEIDGGGAQGIFIALRHERKRRLCGLLVKQTLGIKNAWITPLLETTDMHRYYDEIFDDSVMLRQVDLSYLLTIVNHFLALTLEQGVMPDLHLLEIQEILGLHFQPQKIDADDIFEELSVQISPFTQESIDASLKRSKSWPKNKRFTESWYIENAKIDKIVNRCCSFIDGVKVCRFEEAQAAVFAQSFELYREQWLFHFLWMALWMKSCARKNEKIWQDSFFIAHVIKSGVALESIPIMREICHQSIVNSIETMQERRTYLNQE